VDVTVEFELEFMRSLIEYALCVPVCISDGDGSSSSKDSSTQDKDYSAKERQDEGSSTL
jgi:hypothetical protein